jgi:myxalamid-type polyketide synthase MxaE and MxaD
VIPLNLDLRDTGKAGGLDPLIADLLHRYKSQRAAERRAAVAVSPQAGSANVAKTSALDGLTGDALTRKLETLVTSAVAELLDIDGTRVDLERPLGDLGMDSLLGLEFRKRMQSQCGLVLSATLVWNYPTVRAIVAHIAQRVDGSRASTVQPKLEGEKRDGSAPLDVASLSDEEALRELVGGGERR